MRKISAFYFYCLILFLFSCIIQTANAQSHLKPWFDKNEYIELLQPAKYYTDSAYQMGNTVPDNIKPLYFSKEVGLNNRWSLWLRSDKVAVICLRGTVNNAASWLENFYAGMVPAQGHVILHDKDTFYYDLAAHKKAMVHSGWLIGFSYMARDVHRHIDSLYHTGIKDFCIIGHSQGGALSFYFNAWLNRLKEKGELPDDITLKTYSSAAPKPGNIYFAYEYECMNRNGWAFNIVNADDWVPEMPITIQSPQQDLNNANPILHLKGFFEKQSFIKEMFLRNAYSKMMKRPQKAVDTYSKYLGNVTGDMVAKYLPQYQGPALIKNSYFVRAGNQITLMPDDAYYQDLKDTSTGKIADPHSLKAYIYLVKKYFPN